MLSRWWRNIRTRPTTRLIAPRLRSARDRKTCPTTWRLAILRKAAMRLVVSTFNPTLQALISSGPTVKTRCSTSYFVNGGKKLPSSMDSAILLFCRSLAGTGLITRLPISQRKPMRPIRGFATAPKHYARSTRTTATILILQSVKWLLTTG